MIGCVEFGFLSIAKRARLGTQHELCSVSGS